MPEPAGPPASDDPRPIVVVVHDDPGGHLKAQGWRWFEADFPEVRWVFVSSTPTHPVERRINKPMVSRTRAAWEALRRARAERAKLIISNEPELTFRVALLARRVGLRVPHVAWAFNFSGLPTGRVRRGLMRAGFRWVDRFVIASSMERTLYAETFGVPPHRFDLLLWATTDPEVAHPETPVVPGAYVCALGSNSRDYRTLLLAMTELADIPLVLVANPASLVGLDRPAHVEVRSGISLGEANNILAHSRFAVLPLADGQTPNGHVTLVNSMKLGRASVVTDSVGIHDYAHHDVDALLCPPHSPEAMAGQIRQLWDDPARADRLGAAARQFSRTECDETRSRDRMRRYFQEYGLLPPSPTPGDRGNP